MIARAAASNKRRRRRAWRPRRGRASNLRASSGSPITPVEARKTSWAAAGDLRGDRRGQRDRCRALRAGEGVGVAGIDHQRPRRAARCSASRHQSTGADGHLDRVKTPATVVPASRQSEQHVGSTRIADAGLGGREPDAADGGQLGKGCGRERGEGRAWPWIIRWRGTGGPVPARFGHGAQPRRGSRRAARRLASGLGLDLRAVPHGRLRRRGGRAGRPAARLGLAAAPERASHQAPARRHRPASRRREAPAARASRSWPRCAASG